ncbi:MAG: HlyD family efflux transporter periplasmic adaptor subunit [Oscillochloridaceae bacterium umkhey_bin13]
MFRHGAIALLTAVLLLVGCTPAPIPVTPVASVPTVVPPTPTPGVLPPTFTVRRGEVVEQLLLNGRVAAALDQDVFATTSGFIRELYVERDEPVSAGQLLAELDPGDLPGRIERAQTDIAVAEAQIASARRQRQFAIDAATIQLAAARDNLARLRAGPTPDKLIAAQDRIDRARISLENTRNSTSAAKSNAEIALTNATINRNTAQNAYDAIVLTNGNRPLEELDPAARAAQEQAASALDAAVRSQLSAQIAYDLAVQNEINAVQLAERDAAAAELALQQLQAPPDPFELRAAERAVQAASNSLAQAQSAAGDPSATARIDQLRLSIGELQTQLEASKIYAPFDGVVGEIGVQAGDRVDAFSPIMNIINPDRLLVVVADIASADLQRLAPGQEVEVQLQRYADMALPGRIERLPSDATAPGSMVRPDPLLRISFDPGDRDLNLGDVALVRVVFATVPDALWLPPHALLQFDQRTFVLRLDGDEQRQTDVTVGIRTPERVQIIEGLREGDVVVGPTDLTR